MYQTWVNWTEFHQALGPELRNIFLHYCLKVEGMFHVVETIAEEALVLERIYINLLDQYECLLTLTK